VTERLASRRTQRKRWIVRPCIFAWERIHRIPPVHKGRERAAFCACARAHTRASDRTFVLAGRYGPCTCSCCISDKYTPGGEGKKKASEREREGREGRLRVRLKKMLGYRGCRRTGGLRSRVSSRGTAIVTSHFARDTRTLAEKRGVRGFAPGRFSIQE